MNSLIRLQGCDVNGTYIGPSSSRISENSEFLENILEQFLQTDPSEERLRIFLYNLVPILLEWWSPKPNIIMILWEFFHRKLNLPFYSPGAILSDLAVSSPTGKAYLEKSKELFLKCSASESMSSFSIFNFILGKTINKLFKLKKNNQMQQIFGRIFTKFSVSKFLMLNDIGMHNTIELFITLALSGDIKQITPKLFDILLTIQLEKISLNRKIYIVKGLVALIILCQENSINFSEYAKKTVKQLTILNNDVIVYKILAEGLCEILRNLDKNGSNGEFFLIDTWISFYLNNCLPVEQERLLAAIHGIFQLSKLECNFTANTTKFRDQNLNHLKENNFQQLLEKLNLHIFPFVKQNFATSFSIWIPRLAADFFINFPGFIRTQSATSSNSNIFYKNLEHCALHKYVENFFEAQCLNKEAPLKFVLILLNSNKPALINSEVTIRIWLKSLILLSPNNEDIANLTKFVAKLDEFKCVSNLSENDLVTAKDPLYVYIFAVGQNYQNSDNFNKKCLISDIFNAHLSDFQNWLSDLNEKTDILFRFYSFVAMVIFNCPEIVYAKSKISCFFHVAITRFFLTQSIQMGKLIEDRIIRIIHKIWPVLVQGIGKLSFKSDPYILKTLTDLIVKWIPHFKILQNPKVVSRPFLCCLSNENIQLSMFIFEKLAKEFLTIYQRQVHLNACVVITIFKEIVDANSQDFIKLSLFLKSTGIILLEHLMMAEHVIPSYELLLNVLEGLFKAEAFQNNNEIRTLFTEQLKIITLKHLSFSTYFYFEMLMQVVSISYSVVEPILDFLLEQIEDVEKKRCAGKDLNIRSCYKKLTEVISARKTNKSFQVMHSNEKKSSFL